MEYENSQTAKAVRTIKAAHALADVLDTEGDTRNAALFRELATCRMDSLAGLYDALMASRHTT